MTRAERKKLAKAARELACLYAEGKGPELIAWSWCGCACAKVTERAGLDNSYGAAAERLAALLGDTGPGNGMDLVSEASRLETGNRLGGVIADPVPGAVVFALLWAADELESRR